MKRVRKVVWSERHPDRGDFLLLLECNHVTSSRQQLFETTMCPDCPELKVGDTGPFSHWTPLLTRPLDEEYN